VCWLCFSLPAFVVANIRMDWLVIPVFGPHEQRRRRRLAAAVQSANDGGRGKIRTSAAQQNTTPPKHHQNTNRKKLKYREQKYNKDMVHRVRASQFLFIGRSGQTCHRFFFFFVLLGPNAVCALCAERILWAVMDNKGGGG
jgi:hypothetical protein